MRNPDEELAPVVTFLITVGQKDSSGVYRSATDIHETRLQVSHLLQQTADAVLTRATDALGMWEGQRELTDLWQATASGHAVRTVIRPALARIAADADQTAIGFVLQCNTDTLIFADK